MPEDFSDYRRNKGAKPVAAPSDDPSFSDYKTGKKAAKKAAAPAPAKEKDYRWRDIPAAAYENYGQSMYDFGGNVYDAAMHPLDTVKKAGGMAAAVLDLPYNGQAGVEALKAVGETYKRKYTRDGRPSLQALKNSMATEPISTAADIVTVAGLPAGGGLTVAGRAGQAAGAVGRAAARVAPSVASSRAVGAARAVANTPVGPLGTVGEIAGAGAKALVAPTLSANDAAAFGFRKAIPAIATRARAIADPVHAKVHEMVGGTARASQMRAALAKPPVLPFDVPTPGAQITSQMDAPAIAGWQNVGDALTGANVPRAAAQTRAMQNAVQSIRGGTATPIDQRITDFIGKKQTDAARDYGISDNEWMQLTPSLSRDINLPYNNNILDQATKIQLQNLNTLGQPAAYDIGTRGLLGEYQRLGTPVPTPGARMLSGKDVDLLKKGLNQITNPVNPPTTPIPIEVQKALRDTTSRVVGEARAAIPSYGTSLDNFAANSNNVDATTYARSLSNSLQNAPAGEGTIFSDVGSFSNMRNRAMDSLTGRSAIRQSTGQPRYPLGERSLLRPDESARLDAVQNLIGREASLGQQTRGVTPPNFSSMLSDNLGFRSDTPFLGSLVKGQNAMLEREMAEAVRTGKGLDEVIAKYGKDQKGIDDIAAVYHALTNKYNPLHPLRVMNNNPALYNVLGQRDQQEQQ
jgi:hypothetical protein